MILIHTSTQRTYLRFIKDVSSVRIERRMTGKLVNNEFTRILVDATEALFEVLFRRSSVGLSKTTKILN
jgi:hypothetical protein